MSDNIDTKPVGIVRHEAGRVYFVPHATRVTDAEAVADGTYVYASPATQWRDIATAPRDGTLVLLWERHEDEPFIGRWTERNANGGRWVASTTHYDTDGNACVIDRVYSEGVAYWQPLPAPPVSR